MYVFPNLFSLMSGLDSSIHWFTIPSDRLPAPELQADSTDINPFGAQGKNVAFLFTKDPDKIAIENPLPFIQHPVQPEGLEMVVPCEARTAGAVIYYPLSALIAVGI